MNILVSAYACSPNRGSEPGVGWGFILEISKHHNVVVLVEENEFRLEIEKWKNLNPHLTKNIDFHFIPRSNISILEKIYPPSYYWTYQKWQYDVYNYVKKNISIDEIDIIHHLNMVGFREPGYLWKLHKPFIWGPVGALSYFPLKFLPALNLKGKITYLVYNFLQFLHLKFKLRHKKAAKKAQAIISATAQDQSEIKKIFGKDAFLIEEVGLPLDLYGFSLDGLQKRKVNDAIQIVWSGLLIHRKALSIALQSLAKIDKDRKWKLHIVGDGPLKNEMITLAKKLNIYENCIFHGWIKRSENLEIMKNSHLMLITSLRDLTSTVTIEAMGCGLPIICFDHCGFAGVVNSENGIKIPLTNYKETLELYTLAIEKMFDENVRFELAKGALKNSKKYVWEEKIKILNEIYNSAS